MVRAPRLILYVVNVFICTGDVVSAYCEKAKETRFWLLTQDGNTETCLNSAYTFTGCLSIGKELLTKAASQGNLVDISITNCGVVIQVWHKQDRRSLESQGKITSGLYLAPGNMACKILVQVFFFLYRAVLYLKTILLSGFFYYPIISRSQGGWILWCSL